MSCPPSGPPSFRLPSHHSMAYLTHLTVVLSLKPLPHHSYCQWLLPSLACFHSSHSPSQSLSSTNSFQLCRPSIMNNYFLVEMIPHHTHCCQCLVDSHLSMAQLLYPFQLGFWPHHSTDISLLHNADNWYLTFD